MASFLVQSYLRLNLNFFIIMYDIVANLYLAYEIYYQLLLKLPNF